MGTAPGGFLLLSSAKPGSIPMDAKSFFELVEYFEYSEYFVLLLLKQGDISLVEFEKIIVEYLSKKLPTSNDVTVKLVEIVSTHHKKIALQHTLSLYTLLTPSSRLESLQVLPLEGLSIQQALNIIKGLESEDRRAGLELLGTRGFFNRFTLLQVLQTIQALPNENHRLTVIEIFATHSKDNISLDRILDFMIAAPRKQIEVIQAFSERDVVPGYKLGPDEIAFLLANVKDPSDKINGMGKFREQLQHLNPTGWELILESFVGSQATPEHLELATQTYKEISSQAKQPNQQEGKSKQVQPKAVKQPEPREQKNPDLDRLEDDDSFNFEEALKAQQEFDRLHKQPKNQQQGGNASAEELLIGMRSLVADSARLECLADNIKPLVDITAIQAKALLNTFLGDSSKLAALQLIAEHASVPSQKKLRESLGSLQKVFVSDSEKRKALGILMKL